MRAVNRQWSGVNQIGFYGALCSILLALCVIADAQQAGKIPRIGVVPVSGSPKNPGLLVETFRQGLRELGYIEGKNILIEYRYAGEDPDRVPSFVAELVQLKFDV